MGVRTVASVIPGQIDIVVATKGQGLEHRDRQLTHEIWYPAKPGGNPASYRTLLRDGHTPTTLTGRAIRNSPADLTADPCPVVVISHGYPGNRFLMSHLGENLASKGYVCVSIDHTDSLYEDKAAFASTLVNRPLDQKFALDEIARLSEGNGFLAGVADTSRTGLIGYSMGGYGAIVSAGGGLSAETVADAEASPYGVLAIHRAGSADHEALIDPRFKAVIAIAPWGMAKGLWDADGLAGIEKPLLLVAGSADATSGYEEGVRPIFDGAVATTRYLLTFEDAGHNVAAPIPAPLESWRPSPHLDFAPFEHYADPVWDTVRMNNITQHFATAFLGRFVNGQKHLARYLDTPEQGEEGWPGFQPGTARGLRMDRGQPR